jgi:hypothetical protein
LFRTTRFGRVNGIETCLVVRPYTLYVIELDPEVRTRKRFMAKNPAARPDKPSVYVGMTGRTAEQRFEQHKNGYKANRFARQFGIRLRKRLYPPLARICDPCPLCKPS